MVPGTIATRVCSRLMAMFAAALDLGIDLNVWPWIWLGHGGPVRARRARSRRRFVHRVAVGGLGVRRSDPGVLRRAGRDPVGGVRVRRSGAVRPALPLGATVHEGEHHGARRRRRPIGRPDGDRHRRDRFPTTRHAAAACRSTARCGASPTPTDDVRSRHQGSGRRHEGHPGCRSTRIDAETAIGGEE